MKQLLTNIIARLSEISTLKYVDENWGQADTTQPNAVKYPMALIDVESIEWANLGNHVQDGHANIVIAVSAMRLSNTSKGAPSEQRERSFEFYDLLHAVHCKLHHWRPVENAGSMVRLSQRRIRTQNGIKTTEIIFRVRVEERLPNEYKTIPKPAIIIETTF